MPSFSPPTYEVSADPDNTEHDGRPWGIMRRISYPRGYSVLITAGVATPLPGIVGPSITQVRAADAGSGDGGFAAFIGGKTYTITAGEDTILTNAGYSTGA